jgi:3-dehydroquinate dehydratase / shikimate dehydrogenase
MRQQASLVAALTTPPSLGGAELDTLPEAVQWLEVRADLVGDIAPDWLRQHFPGRLLYTLRSRAAGGAGADVGDGRRARLRQAALHYDLITLEAEHDLRPDLLQAIPPWKRLLSWYGPATDVHGLGRRFQQLSAVAARLYMLLPQATQPGEALLPLTFLHALGRRDTVAYAAGSVGCWSRLLAPRLGAPLVFGNLGESSGTDGALTITQLLEDYGLPALPPVRALYGIVGYPVAHSLSPRLHNAAYRTLGYPALYVPFEVHDFADFWRLLVEGETLASLGMPLQGLTVVSPHKEQTLAVAKVGSALVRCAGASNVCVRRHSGWHADTTDADGVLLTLRERGVRVAGQRVAVIGCGGAGRTVAAGLAQAGAKVTLVNRGSVRGRHASQRLALPFVPLSTFRADDFHIVVHATPMGRDDHALPFAPAGLGTEAAVVDLVYGTTPTPLVAMTRALGRVVIDGRDVLLAQARRQFRLMTGRNMPRRLAHAVLSCEVEACDAIAVGA